MFIGHLYVLVALCILKIEFFFCYWLLWVIYIFWALTNPLRICFEKYFSHSTGCLFIFMLLCRSFLVLYSSAAAAKSLQSCPTLCDPIDGSPPGSPVPGILQAGTLEWFAISFSNAWKWKVKVKSLSRVRLHVTPWTAAYQAPPSMGFSRQEYWSGVPLPSPYLVAGNWKSRHWMITEQTECHHWF